MTLQSGTAPQAAAAETEDSQADKAQAGETAAEDSSVNAEKTDAAEGATTEA